MKKYNKKDNKRIKDINKDIETIDISLMKIRSYY